MTYLIWIGALLTLLGVFGLMACVRRVAKARREETNDDQLRARLQGVVALNLLALLLSAIGLMMVVIGILLGGGASS